MKKKILVLLLVVLTIIVSGCAKLEQGIVFNSDGSGYIYLKELALEGEDVDSEIDEEFEERAITQEIREIIDGDEYKGTMSVVEFNSLEKLREFDIVDIVEDDETVTITLKNVEEDIEEAAGEEIDFGAMDDFVLEMVKNSFDLVLKIDVAGEVLETSGVVDGSSVSWDIIEDLENENAVYAVKYRKAEGIKRDPVTDGILKPGSDYVTVIMSNERVFFPDQRPVIEDGRTLVPARAISENLDAEVEWIPDKTVVITKDDKIITLTIDQKEVVIQEGEELSKITIDVPAKIINGRTMIPLRAVSGLFDMNVEWDQETYTATIF